MDFRHALFVAVCIFVAGYGLYRLLYYREKATTEDDPNELGDFK